MRKMGTNIGTANKAFQWTLARLAPLNAGVRPERIESIKLIWMLFNKKETGQP